MKRWIFLCVAGLVALVEILLFLSPSLVFDLLDLIPATLPTPPKAFDVRREGIERGAVEIVEYDSKAAGGTRKMCVYTPPGFSSNNKQCPVLYLLHGSLADETSWVEKGAADTILDNLYADNRLVPMIVVMPNGNLPGFGIDAFELDLLGDVIPYVEKHFAVKADREHRALAGLSAGVQQALSIALAHPDKFAYIGAFIGGMLGCEEFEKEHQDTLDDLATNRKPKLLWFANGRNDMTYELCQQTLRLLDKYKIHYVYLHGKGQHSWETGRNDLFVFAPLLFHDTN